MLGDRALNVEVRDAEEARQLVMGPRIGAAAQRRFDAELSVEDESGLRRLRIGGRSVDLLLSLSDGRCSVALEGVALDLLVADERVARLGSLQGPTTTSVGPTKVVAPIPGLVVRVEVQAGQAVRHCEVLLALQAMKMENELASPRDAVVKAVCVQVGQAVELGQLLVQLE